MAHISAPIRHSDLIVLKREGADAFLATSGVPCEAPEMGFLRVRMGTGNAFQAESVFEIEILILEAGSADLHYGEAFRLKHVRSQSYLAALGQETCALLDGRSAHTARQFTLVPRYKLQQDGDVVYGRDNAIIQSRLYPTVSLSIASGTPGMVTLSTSAQGWMVEHFAKASAASAERVKGGDVIRLQHAHSEGYITTCRDDAEVREKEGPLREVLTAALGSRLFTESFESDAPGSRSLLVIELAHPRMGDLLLQSQPCRLKSSADNKYLCCVGGSLKMRARPMAKAGRDRVMSVSLDPSQASVLSTWEDSSLFHLKPVKRISEQDTLLFGSYVYITHLQSADGPEGEREYILRVAANAGDSTASDADSDAGSRGSQQTGANDEDDSSALSEIELVPASLLSDRDAFRILTVDVEEAAHQCRILKMQQELVKVYARIMKATPPDEGGGVLSTQTMEDWGLSQPFPQLTSGKPPTKSDCDAAVIAIRYLIRFVLGVSVMSKMSDAEILSLSHRPLPARQQLLRNSYIIEWLLGIIDLGWCSPSLFDKDAKLVTAVGEMIDSADGKVPSGTEGALLPLFRVMQLAHNLLKRLLTSNHENALVVNEMDVSEQLLSAFMTEWRPAVTEYYGSLLAPTGADRDPSASAGADVDGATKLWKSDLYVLVEQIHMSLKRENGCVRDARILDFLASVCTCDGKQNEELQVAILQLLVGLLADGLDPHQSSLIMHLRLVATPQDMHNGEAAVSPHGMHFSRFGDFCVQVKTSPEGLKRPCYQPDPLEVRAQLKAMSEMPKHKGKSVQELKKALPDNLTPKDYDDDDIANLADVDEKHDERHWISLAEFLKPVADGNERQLKEQAYFRSQLRIFIEMASGNRRLIEETLRLLVPLDLLLTMAEDEALLAIDRQLATQLVTALYVNSSELPPTRETLVAQLQFWGDERLHIHDEERVGAIEPAESFVRWQETCDLRICSRTTQSTKSRPLEPDRSAFGRRLEPVAQREREQLEAAATTLTRRVLRLDSRLAKALGQCKERLKKIESRLPKNLQKQAKFLQNHQRDATFFEQLKETIDALSNISELPEEIEELELDEAGDKDDVQLQRMMNELDSGGESLLDDPEKDAVLVSRSSSREKKQDTKDQRANNQTKDQNRAEHLKKLTEMCAVYEALLGRYYRLRARAAMWDGGIVPIWMAGASLPDGTRGGLWVGGERKAAAGPASNAQLVKGYIFLSNETVMRQRQRLLRFVKRGLEVVEVVKSAGPPGALSSRSRQAKADLRCPLLKKPPYQLSGSAEPPSLEREKERLAFDLSLLELVYNLTANGFFVKDYISPVIEGCTLSLADVEQDFTHQDGMQLCDWRSATFGLKWVEAGMVTRELRSQLAAKGEEIHCAALSEKLATRREFSRDEFEGIVEGAAPLRYTSFIRSGDVFFTLAEPIDYMLDDVRELEASLHRILERSSPLQCLAQFSLGAAGTLKTTDAKRLAMQCMLGLEGEQDLLIAEGKRVICKTLQSLYQMYTDARLQVLLSQYKSIYRLKLEQPLFIPQDKSNDRYEEEYTVDKFKFELECRRVLLEPAQFGSRANAQSSHVMKRETRLMHLLVSDKEREKRAKEVLQLTLCYHPEGHADGLVAEALGALNSMFSERRDLHQAISSVLLLVDPAEEKVVRYVRKQSAELEKLLKKPDEVVWEKEDISEKKTATDESNDDDSSNVWIRFDADDADELEAKFMSLSAAERSVVDASVDIRIDEIDYKINFSPATRAGDPTQRSGNMVLINKATGYAISVRREAAIDKLITLMVDFEYGVVPLCYHKYNVWVCTETGKPFDTREELDTHKMDGYSGLGDRLTSDGEPNEDRELYQPTPDDIEAPNQEILRREGWHHYVLHDVLMRNTKAMLSYLRWRDSNGQADFMREAQLYFYYACFQFLYYFCWDNAENRQALSDRGTIDFIFGVLEKLEKISRLHIDVPPQYNRELSGKGHQVKLSSIILQLLAEILEDNSQANEKLHFEAHVLPVVRGLFSYATSPRGETQHPVAALTTRAAFDTHEATESDRGGMLEGRDDYIQLLKAMVEDEIGPLPQRQEEVVRAIQTMRGAFREKLGEPTSRRSTVLFTAIDLVLPLHKTDGGKYDWQHVFELYLEDYKTALDKDWAPPPDGLPDPDADDSPLAFHLEVVDLVAMCAKGDMKNTEDFALSLFSLDDVLEVLMTGADDLGAACKDRGLATRKQLPLLMRSPFLRLLHGMFFSISAADKQAEAVSAKFAPVFKDYNAVVKIMNGIVLDIKTFIELVLQEAKKDEDDNDENEDDEKSTSEASKSTDAAKAAKKRGSLMRKRSTGEAEDMGDDQRTLSEKAEEWMDDDYSSYEYYTMLEEHSFWVAIPFLRDFLQVTANMPLLVPVVQISGGDRNALVIALQSVCKALMLLACLQDVMEDNEQFRNSTKQCLDAFDKREYVTTPGAPKAKLISELQEKKAIEKIQHALERGSVVPIDNNEIEELLEELEPRSGATGKVATDDASVVSSQRSEKPGAKLPSSAFLASRKRMETAVAQVSSPPPSPPGDVGEALNGKAAKVKKEGALWEADTARYLLPGCDEMSRMLSGEEDYEARELLIHKAYVNVFCRRLFVDALGSALWDLELSDLLERGQVKNRAQQDDGRKARDFESLLLEKIPQRAVALARKCGVDDETSGEASAAEEEAILAMMERDGYAKRHLFKEMSAEFNQLVELYSSRLIMYMIEVLDMDADMLQMADLPDNEGEQIKALQEAMEAANLLDEARAQKAASFSQSNRRLQLQRMKSMALISPQDGTAYQSLRDEAGSKAEHKIADEIARMTEVQEITLKKIIKTAPELEEPLSLALAYRELTKAGGLYFDNLFGYIRSHSHASTSEQMLCEFLLDVAKTLLTTNIKELQEGREQGADQQEIFEDERMVLFSTQEALNQLGAAQTMIDVIGRTGADVANWKPTSKRALSTMLRFGLSMLDCPGGQAVVQNEVLLQMRHALVDPTGRTTDVMRVLHSMLRRHIPSVRKMREIAVQPGKTAAEQKKVFEMIREDVENHLVELSWLQLLTEGHNRAMQTFLRDQGSASPVNVLMMVIEYVKEVADATVVTIEDAYIEDDSFVADFIGRCAKAPFASKEQRVVGWYQMTETEITLMVQQMKLFKAGIDTLTEFVQGPNEANQLAAIQAELIKRLLPIFEIASSFNLAGIVLTASDGVSKLAPERWTGGEVLLSLRAQYRMVQVLKEQYSSTGSLQDVQQGLNKFINKLPKRVQEWVRSDERLEGGGKRPEGEVVRDRAIALARRWKAVPRPTSWHGGLAIIENEMLSRLLWEAADGMSEIELGEAELAELELRDLRPNSCVRAFDPDDEDWTRKYFQPVGEIPWRELANEESHLSSDPLGWLTACCRRETGVTTTPASLDGKSAFDLTSYLASAHELVELVDDVEKSTVRLLLGLMEGNSADSAVLKKILSTVHPRTLINNLDLHSQRLQLLKGVSAHGAAATVGELITGGWEALAGKFQLGAPRVSLLDESDLSTARWLASTPSKPGDALEKQRQEQKHQQEIVEEELFVFLYYSMSTQLREASRRSGGSTTGTGTISAMLDDWEEVSSTVKGTCIRVEIVSEEGKLQDMYFQRPAKVARYWGSRETADFYEKMLIECNKSNNAEEKLRTFLNMQDHLLNVMDHMQDLDNLASSMYVVDGRLGHGLLSRLLRKLHLKDVAERALGVLKPMYMTPLILAQYIAKGNALWWQGSLAVVLWVCFYVLEDYTEIFLTRRDAVGDDDHDYYSSDTFFGRPLNRVFDAQDPGRAWKVTYPSLVQNTLAFFMLVSHLIVGGWVGVTQRLRDNPEGIINLSPFRDMPAPIRVPTWLLALLYFFTDAMTLYHIFYFVNSVVAGRFFFPLYTLCLIDLAIHNLTMQYILGSITRNVDRLFYSVVFAFILIWILATYAFFTPSLRSKYTLGDHNSHENLLAFVRLHWDYGLREAPSFIDDDFADADGREPWVGFSFNVVYNFFVLLVMTAIVSGIIIDTFSEMRAEDDAVKEARDNLCFICSIQRDRFETAGVDLNSHRSTEHAPENYIFLRIFLSEKDPNEYTGQEQYVKQCIDQKNIRFFPLKKAGRLEHVEEDESELNEMASRIESLEETVETVRSASATHTKLLEELMEEMRKLTAAK